MLNVNRTIISFREIPDISEAAHKSRLLLRHSYRESLQGGNLDPGLTAEGWDYAVQWKTVWAQYWDYPEGRRQQCFCR